MPRLSRLEGSGNVVLQSEIIVAARVIGLAACTFSIFGLMYGREFLILWLGNNFLESYYAFIFLAIAVMINYSLDGLSSFLFATSKQHVLARVTILQGLIIIVSAFFLIGEYGILGVTGAVVLGSIGRFIFLLPSGCRHADIPVLTYLIYVLFPLTCFSIVLFSVLMIVKAMVIFSALSWTGFAVNIALGIASTTGVLGVAIWVLIKNQPNFEGPTV